MAKGYWVVFADVSDPEGCKEYIAANAKALARYGARILARGGKTEAKEGKPRFIVTRREGRSVWDMGHHRGIGRSIAARLNGCGTSAVVA